MNINRYINFERLLTLNYKKIGLSDDEYLLLSITYELVQTGTKFVNPADLSLLCNFTPVKIDVVYSGLIEKKLISNEFSKNNTVYTSFDGIVKKLLSCLEDEVDIQEAKDRKSKIVEEDVFEYMQKSGCSTSHHNPDPRCFCQQESDPSRCTHNLWDNHFLFEKQLF